MARKNGFIAVYATMVLVISIVFILWVTDQHAAGMSPQASDAESMKQSQGQEQMYVPDEGDAIGVNTTNNTDTVLLYRVGLNVSQNTSGNDRPLISRNTQSAGNPVPLRMDITNDSVRGYLPRLHGVMPGSGYEFYYTHALTSPIIWIAGDHDMPGEIQES